MIGLFLRPAGLALLFGFTALSASAANAGSFGSNFNVRSPSQSFPQTVYAGGGRPNIGQPSYTPPPNNYGAPRPRVHEFDYKTQFDGINENNSTNGKLK